MTYKLNPEHCKEPGCTRPVFEFGWCRPCWELARSFGRLVPGCEEMVLSEPGGDELLSVRGEGPGVEPLELPSAEWLATEFDRELNAWRGDRR